MTTTSTPTTKPLTPNYGIDAPSVLRNLLLAGAACLAIAIFFPPRIHFGTVSVVTRSFFWPAGFLIGEGLLFLFYVKVGKLWHRDKMLSLISWRGDERVLDVGCGRGLLLIGAAKHLTTGHATGIDLWSNVDMGNNSSEATQRNLEIEGVADHCTVLSIPAQDMTFPDGAFDIILSNLCIHNIYDRPTRLAALRQIARVLAPGGTALISDYKRTNEYFEEFRASGLQVEKRRGSIIATFPPLTVIIARKPS